MSKTDNQKELQKSVDKNEEKTQITQQDTSNELEESVATTIEMSDSPDTNNNIFENSAVPDFELFDIKSINYDRLTTDQIQTLNGHTLDEAITECKNQISILEHDIFGKMHDHDNEDNATSTGKVNNNDTQVEHPKDRDKHGDIIYVPIHSVPIRADVCKFNWKLFIKTQQQTSKRLFDIIMMDPPWQLASSNPTRGVALGYSQLSDQKIRDLPVIKLQTDGFLFIWVINAKYRLGLQLMHDWGYKLINTVAWVKQTVNRRIANGHGYYLQHAKESCLVGVKGDINIINNLRQLSPQALHGNKYDRGVCSDVIYSERRGQSQKPQEIYEIAERLIPNGNYLEIFGRRNNLRNGWITIGNEL